MYRVDIDEDPAGAILQKIRLRGVGKGTKIIPETELKEVIGKIDNENPVRDEGEENSEIKINNKTHFLGK